MSKIFSMNELGETTSNPFEKYGVFDDDYIAIDDILNVPVIVCDIKAFENNKGPGVFLLIKRIEDNSDALSSKPHLFNYVCTHSVNITSKFTSDKVKEVLAGDSDHAIGGMFIERKSKKSDRMAYDFV